MPRAPVQAVKTCGEARSNGHAAVQSATPGSNGHAAPLRTRMPRASVQTPTPHGFKSPRHTARPGSNGRASVQTATPGSRGHGATNSNCHALRPGSNGHDVWRGKRSRRVARPRSNGYASVQSATPGSNGHAAPLQTRMPRAPSQIATPHGEARFKRPHIGSARHARFTRPRRYQCEPSCFAP